MLSFWAETWRKIEENAKKSQDGSNKPLSILSLMLNKLYVSLYFFSTYALRVNITWYVKNIFSFLDKIFMFSIHFHALSPLSFLYGCSSPVLASSVNLLSNDLGKYLPCPVGVHSDGKSGSPRYIHLHMFWNMCNLRQHFLCV